MMLCDGVIWYRALFANAKLAQVRQEDPVLGFVVIVFFAYVALLLWHATRDD
jgi:hypothetical protein